MNMSKESLADFGLLFLRVMVGAGIAYHGYGKVFGGDVVKLIEGVTNMGFPYPKFFAWAAALSEFVGGICIALGLFTRVAAFFLFITMSVAAFKVHGADPLQKKELALAYWTIAGSLIFLGGGNYSIGRFFKK